MLECCPKARRRGRYKAHKRVFKVEARTCKGEVVRPGKSEPRLPGQGLQAPNLESLMEVMGGIESVAPRARGGGLADGEKKNKKKKNYCLRQDGPARVNHAVTSSPRGAGPAGISWLVS